MSLIAYGVLAAIATVVSLGMILSVGGHSVTKSKSFLIENAIVCISKPRACSFFLVTTTTTLGAAGAFLLDMISAKASNKTSAGAEHLGRVSNALDCLAGFLSRIPDELELTHRFQNLIADHYFFHVYNSCSLSCTGTLQRQLW